MHKRTIARNTVLHCLRCSVNKSPCITVITADSLWTKSHSHWNDKLWTKGLWLWINLQLNLMKRFVTHYGGRAVHFVQGLVTSHPYPYCASTGQRTERLPWLS